MNGYHVCEAIILGKNEKQPIRVYSDICSGKSKKFISKSQKHRYSNKSFK